MPGPPFGPRYRSTITSPASMPPSRIAFKADCSSSKTLAGPVMTGFFSPVILATAPSVARLPFKIAKWPRSEEHTSELQSLMRTSYAVFRLKKKKSQIYTPHEQEVLYTLTHTQFTNTHSDLTALLTIT